MKIKTLLFAFISISTIASINPSILLFHEFDLNRCPAQIEKINQLNPISLKIVNTLHFSHKNKKVTKLCLKRNGCETISKETIKRMTKKLRLCLSKLNKKISILYTPHIDDLNDHKLWRNYAKLDPLKKLQNDISYYDVLIKPFIQISDDLKLKTIISLQGEMGASIFSYPGSYLSINEQIQKQGYQTAISLNHNQISGKVFTYSKTKVNRLLASVNFVGFSAYQPIRKNLNAYFNSLKNQFNHQLVKRGLKALKTNKIFFSEIGIGGGKRLNNNDIASSLRELKRNPHSGSSTQNPWLIKKYTDYRRQYYKSMNDYAKQSGTMIYMWNADSWDPLGLYPTSKQYQDEVIRSFLF